MQKEIKLKQKRWRIKPWKLMINRQVFYPQSFYYVYSTFSTSLLIYLATKLIVY